ncbi:MAG: transporter permease [Naasia sp.]|jgi:hypothetical protein|uniref:DUF4097 family beta strand repeat-containing protein n=1 Tax=Naasia sp. TaxID=2546198 RepID=UPI002611D95F|nr:DUF4097 family beta strand repeat-containing protein [Naasia sp.]MCU1570885.1 transporter permease [Naasia sp.]
MAEEKWLVTEPKVLDLSVVHSLKVSLIGGRIDVIGTDEPTARLEVSGVSGRELLVKLEGTSLEIDHPQLRWDNFLDVFRSYAGKASATVSLLLPRTATVRLGVIGADALVSGMRTDVRLNSVSGDLMLDASEGDVELNSVSGALSVRGHRGGVSVRTVSGEVAASGDLRSFSCEGVTGDVFIDTAGVPERVETNTVSGRTTVRLPAGAPARFTVNTVSGTAQLDDQVFRGLHGRGQNVTSGDLSGLWTDVRCNSVSGDIIVVHSVPSTEGVA